jgi:hypothetical protein
LNRLSVQSGTKWFLTLVVPLLLGFAACRKAPAPVDPSTEYFGIKVEWPRLDTEFANPTQELRDNLAMIKRFFRLGQIPRARAELEKLASNPALTEPQKKLVNTLLDQTRQVIEKAPSQ